MTILGIETSCDETSAAVIEGDKNTVRMKSNITASSLGLHAETGGIIPESAAREQLKYILPVIKEALQKAFDTPDTLDTLKKIDAIAVTYGPGLIGSLLVGVETAKTFSYVLRKPLIPINHMIGHIYATFIDQTTAIEFPLIALVVSGGHTDLLLMKNHGDFQLLGGTRDDAAGECFDKCARLLGYTYPGGPKISQLALKGDPKAFAFPRPMIGSHDYNFSFSGLKTAFLNTTRQHFSIKKTGWQQVILDNELSKKDEQTVYDLCASLQKAIVDVLVKKTIKAAKEHNVKTILLSGGVSANDLLRETFQNESVNSSLQFFAPPKSLSTDNGAMIASAAFYNYKPVNWKEITADPELYFEPAK